MNADQEQLLRVWLAGRDPGEAPTRLRAAVADVPATIRAPRLPALHIAVARFFGLSPTARVAVLVVILAVALAVVGAVLLQPWRPFPPRGLIAYTVGLGSPGGGIGVVLVAADGAGQRRVAAAAAETIDQSPRWSPDGRTLAFARLSNLDPVNFCGGIGSIVLYDLATARERVVATGLRPIHELIWSPSGDQVAFIGPMLACNMDGELGIVDLASGNVTTSPLQTLVDGGRVVRELRWESDRPSATEPDPMRADVPSGDGRHTADCGEDLRDPGHRLVIRDRQTGASVDVGPGQAGVWSPDGMMIAFIQPAGRGSPGQVEFADRLAVADAATGRVRVLASDVATTFASRPTLHWTADGGAIYWLDIDGAAHVVDVVTGRSSELPGVPEGSTDLRWQPLPGA